MNQDLDIAITAAVEAGKEILKIYGLSKIETEAKSDSSPLTLADIRANDIINSYLRKTRYRTISEENKQTDFMIRRNWSMCWIVDPLDGTKEFIKRNGEFTVNIALCKDGNPVLGVIYVPVDRALYYADVKSKKAFKTLLDDEHRTISKLFSDEDRIYPSLGNNKELLRVAGSRSHMNEETAQFIDRAKKDFENVETVSKGSSIKFCLVAEGKADVYPRFAPTMEWDTAAGHALCSAVGLKVISQETQSGLLYNKENLLNPHFLVSN